MTAPRASAVVSVLLPLPLGTYDYSVPEGMGARVGAFVRVPLGPRHAVGVIWGEGQGHVAPARLRDIEAVLDAPPLAAPLRHFIDWVAGYTLAAPGAVLRMAMSVPVIGVRPETVLVRGKTPARMTPQRAAALAAVDKTPLSRAELARAAGVSSAVVGGLIRAGALIPVVSEPPAPDPSRPGPALSPAQDAAARALVADVAERGFRVSLLDGVTGAGKTEVYFEALAAALAGGRQVLVLLPEIALGAQWLRRFDARFGARPAEWHSDLTSARRRATWRDVAEGRARAVVGARSALFLPFRDLGLIVVDEEHDPSFKQDDGVAYNARDMAVVRARLADIPVALASATPSLETLRNAEAGRYRRLHLPERHGAALPLIEAVDMRSSPPPRGRWLSPPLADALAETFERGEQTLLFLNRRGYAPLTLCRACGHRLECPNCSAWLVEHRLAAELRCHHCDHRAAVPARCPACGADESLVACGPGIERVADEVAARFPASRLVVMASDTVHGPGAAADLVAAVLARRIDVLVGTQMVTKGHHFPHLTLVGVVDADLGLSGGDLRAAERTYQLLFQVAGRAGRAERPGRALLQTYAPRHPVIEALVAGDRDAFVAAELAARRAAGMPPYGRLAAVIVSGTDAEAARGCAAQLGRTAPRGDGVSVLGPAPAPLALIRGRHRFRLLVKGRRPLQPVLGPWLAGVKPGRGVRVRVDVDPYSFA